MEALNHLEDLKSKFFGLHDEIWELRDKRVDGWFMMSSPLPTIVICLIYVYLVTIWGPKYMKNREPINCQKFMLIYNAVQVLFSAYVFGQGIMAGWFIEYSFSCQPMDFSERGYAMVIGVWMCHISKYLDFVDTFCFIARKKFNQVTVLHVYHHSIMPLSVWIYLRFLPGGHGTFPGFINSFVHIIMYTYYLISGLGPQFQKYVWWKSYVTKLQLVQFTLIIIHSSQLLFKNDCNYPVFSGYFHVIHSFIFFALFTHFYAKSYLSAKKQKNELKSKRARDNKTESKERNNNNNVVKAVEGERNKVLALKKSKKGN